MKFLILAGGSGTRLWPLSNDEMPKQFHSFVSDRTLLQMAFDRLDFADYEDIYVSTNEKYRDIVKSQLPELSEKNIICEPARRDTAPCIAFAMKYIADDSASDEVVTIINADQLIIDNEEFTDVVNAAQKVALEKNKLVLVSVKTKSPNPNLGYIKIDSLLEKYGDVEVYGLDKFVEKPNVDRATVFHSSYKYLWNTAIFTWKIETFLGELKNHARELYDTLMSIDDYDNCKDQYENFEKISIDFALMEKVDKEKVNVIPADLGWSDIGTWETLHEELEKNEDGNVVQGAFVVENVKNSLLINRTDSVCLAYKMEGMVMVKTKEAVLIGDIKDSSTLKKLVNKL